jgi:hypothetical protein
MVQLRDSEAAGECCEKQCLTSGEKGSCGAGGKNAGKGWNNCSPLADSSDLEKPGNIYKFRCKVIFNYLSFILFTKLVSYKWPVPKLVKYNNAEI